MNIRGNIGRWAALGGILALSVAASALLTRHVSFVRVVENWVSDLRIAATPRQSVQNKDIIVVAITEDTLATLPYRSPVVDLSVTLTDGQHHAVDSSEMAFKQAGRLAMSEGLPQCKPVLLEPISKVTISLPSEFTSKAQRMISGRRGQILGFDAKPGWKSWDEVSALMPWAEIHDLIIELRSLTFGAGSYTFKFDHMQELSGRNADQVVAARTETKKAS